MSYIKGTISDSLGLNRVNLTQKRLFMRLNSVGLSIISLHGKISLNFGIKFCVSLSIKHIKPLK